MKNLTTLLLLIPLISFGQVAFLDIEFGMNKNQIKKIINSDKDSYKSVPVGNYLWRYYHQNNVYDEKGGVVLIKLLPKGMGLSGFPEHTAKIVFEDLITMLTQQGYSVEDVNIKSDNYFEFKANETYTFKNKEKGKEVYIGTPVFFGEKILLNLVIGKYTETKVAAGVL